MATLLLAACRPVVALPSGSIHAADENQATSAPNDAAYTNEQEPTVPLSPTAADRPLLGSGILRFATPIPSHTTRHSLPATSNSTIPAPDSPHATPISFAALDSALATPPTPIPSPAIPFAKPDSVINILLLGNDVPWAQGGRTDSILLISLNRETGKIKILSVPRDLYVVIPGWQMNRINLALPHGHGSDYPGGGGGLVKDTILYNLGIPIDYYVRIGFSGFKEVVDGLGGVEVVVNCPIEDWRLRDPDLDPELESNWEPYLLVPGIQNMDGELALWYVRSRKNSNDIDRGRRQQKIMHALLQKTRSAALLHDLPLLWNSFSQMYETDMQLTDLLELAALVPKIDAIEHLLLNGEAIRPWTVPHSGDAVQLLNREAAEPLLSQFMSESALHDVDRAPIKVEVETNDPIMYRQVADNLLWYGFEPSLRQRRDPDPEQTTITYSGSSTKGAFGGRLASIFRQDVNDIIIIENGETNSAGYHIDLGRRHNPCLPYLELDHP